MASSSASARSPPPKGGKGHDKFSHLDEMVDKSFFLPGFTRLEVLKAVSDFSEPQFGILVEKIVNGSFRESDVPNLKNKTKTNNTASSSSPEEEGWSTTKTNKTVAVVSFSPRRMFTHFFTSFFLKY